MTPQEYLAEMERQRDRFLQISKASNRALDEYKRKKRFWMSKRNKERLRISCLHKEWLAAGFMSGAKEAREYLSVL